MILNDRWKDVDSKEIVRNLTNVFSFTNVHVIPGTRVTKDRGLLKKIGVMTM